VTVTALYDALPPAYKTSTVTTAPLPAPPVGLIFGYVWFDVPAAIPLHVRVCIPALEAKLTPVKSNSPLVIVETFVTAAGSVRTSPAVYPLP